MYAIVSSFWLYRVALRKESVDRNQAAVLVFALRYVALRKESVDRNSGSVRPRHGAYVALRKESVDRNWAVDPRTASGWRRSPQGERG